MISKDSLLKIVENILQEKELFLVDVKCSVNNEVEVIVDGIKGVSITDCIDISKDIESNLNRDIEDYELTVASAGIGDPLKLTAQYLKHENKEVEVVLKNGDKISGIMTKPNDNNFCITYSKKVLEEGQKRKVTKEFTDIINRDDVKSTRLVIKF